MAYGRSKLLLNGELTQRRVASLSTLRSAPRIRITADSERELDTLRCMNAHLLSELAVLKERQAEVLRLAERDGLTGLYNRRRMLELLDSAITEALQRGQCVGLLFIDLNGFKAVNDEYGHAAGDKILTTMAMRIAARVRNGDFVCRYGGDEFVVVLPNVPDAAAVTRVADTIRERVALPCWLRGQEQHLTAAIGESLFPRDGNTAQELLERADRAMYVLKARLARPMVSLGSNKPHERLARRRNDHS
jgi:diguanylate cyclase (GGDEF)-like protein